MNTSNSTTIVSRMRIYDHQKTEACKTLLETLGFTVRRSSNSRQDRFWEVYDKDGLPFATTLHDGELLRLTVDVLTFDRTEITGRDVLKARSL